MWSTLDIFYNFALLFFYHLFWIVLLITSRSNLHILKSIMEKVELLLHLRGNMHHYPGILIFVYISGKCDFLLSIAFFFFWVNTHICLPLDCQPCWFKAVNADHAYCIQTSQDKIWLGLQKISPSVASKRLRSQPLIGMVVSLWPGLLYKLLQIFKVWWLLLVCISLLLHFPLLLSSLLLLRRAQLALFSKSGMLFVKACFIFIDHCLDP